MSNLSGEESGNTKDQLIRSLLDSLSSKGVSEKDVLSYLQRPKEEKIPLSIFRSSLSPLQAIIYYLKEHRGKNYSSIAVSLHRDQRSVWNTFAQAKKKISGDVPVFTSSYDIPLSSFADRNLSVLEALCCYLRREHELSYHQIASLLSKDDRTIWTVCRRAEKKQGDGS
jgi:hypothetical protein